MDLLRISKNVAFSALGCGVLDLDFRGPDVSRLASGHDLSKLEGIRTAKLESIRDADDAERVLIRKTLSQYMKEIAKIYKHSLFAITKHSDPKFEYGDVFIFSEFSNDVRSKFGRGVVLSEDTSFQDPLIKPIVPILEILDIDNNELRTAIKNLPSVEGGRLLSDDTLHNLLSGFRGKIKSVSQVEEIVKTNILYSVDANSLANQVYSAIGSTEDIAKVLDAVQKIYTKIFDKIPLHVKEAAIKALESKEGVKIREGIGPDKAKTDIIHHLKMRNRVGIGFGPEDLDSVIKNAINIKTFGDGLLKSSKSGEFSGFYEYMNKYSPNECAVLLSKGPEAKVSILAIKHIMGFISSYKEYLEEEFPEHRFEDMSDDYFYKNVDDITNDYVEIPDLSGLSDDFKTVSALNNLDRNILDEKGISKEHIRTIKGVPGSIFVDSGTRKITNKDRSKHVFTPSSEDESAGRKDKSSIHLSIYLPIRSTLRSNMEKVLSDYGLSDERISKEYNWITDDFSAVLSHVNKFSSEGADEVKDVSELKKTLSDKINVFLSENSDIEYMRFIPGFERIQEVLGNRFDLIGKRSSLANRYNELIQYLNESTMRWESNYKDIIQFASQSSGRKLSASGEKFVYDNVLSSLNLFKASIQNDFRGVGEFKEVKESSGRIVHITFRDKTEGNRFISAKSAYESYFKNVGSLIKKVIPKFKNDSDHVTSLINDLGAKIEDDYSSRPDTWVQRIKPTVTSSDEKLSLSIPSTAREFFLKNLVSQSLNTLISNERQFRGDLAFTEDHDLNQKIVSAFANRTMLLVLTVLDSIGKSDKDASSKSYELLGKRIDLVNKDDKTGSVNDILRQLWRNTKLDSSILDKVFSGKDITSDPEISDYSEKNLSKIGDNIRNTQNRISRYESSIYGFKEGDDSEKVSKVKKTVDDIIKSDVGSDAKMIRDISTEWASRRSGLKKVLDDKIKVLSRQKDMSDEEEMSVSLTPSEVKKAIESSVQFLANTISLGEVKRISEERSRSMGTPEGPVDYKEVDKISKLYLSGLDRYCESVSVNLRTVKSLDGTPQEVEIFNQLRGGNVDVHELIQGLPSGSKLYLAYQKIRDKAQHEFMSQNDERDFTSYDSKAIDQAAAADFTEYLKGKNTRLNTKKLSLDAPAFETESGDSLNLGDTLSDPGLSEEGDASSKIDKGLINTLVNQTKKISNDLKSKIEKEISRVKESKAYLEPSEDKTKFDEFLKWWESHSKSGKRISGLHEHDVILILHRYLDDNPLVKIAISYMRPHIFQLAMLSDFLEIMENDNIRTRDKIEQAFEFTINAHSGVLESQSDSLLRGLYQGVKPVSESGSTLLKKKQGYLSMARDKIRSYLREAVKLAIHQNSSSTDEEHENRAEELHNVLKSGVSFEGLSIFYKSLMGPSGPLPRGMNEFFKLGDTEFKGRFRDASWNALKEDTKCKAMLELLKEITKSGGEIKSNELMGDPEIMESFKELFYDLTVFYTSFINSQKLAESPVSVLSQGSSIINYSEQVLHGLNLFLKGRLGPGETVERYKQPDNEVLLETQVYKEQLDSLKSDTNLLACVFLSKLGKMQISGRYKDDFKKIDDKIRTDHEDLLSRIGAFSQTDYEGLFDSIESSVNFSDSAPPDGFGLNQDSYRGLKLACITGEGLEDKSWGEEVENNKKILKPISSFSPRNSKKMDELGKVIEQVLPGNNFPKWNWDVSSKEPKPSDYYNIPLTDDFLKMIKAVHDAGKSDPRRTAQAESLSGYLAEKIKEFNLGNNLGALTSCLTWMSKAGIGERAGIDLSEHTHYIYRLKSLPKNKDEILKFALESGQKP